MSKPLHAWTLGAALTLLAGSAAAEPLSLDDAIHEALNQNPELLAASLRVEAAEARAKAARGDFLPQVGVRYLARRSDNPLDAFADKLNTRQVDPATDFTAQALNQPDPSTIHATQLSVELPLYTGGRRAAALRETGAMADASRLNASRVRQLTAFRTLSAYRNAQAAGVALSIADDAVAAARQHAETTARLVRQGRTVASDRLTAELNLSAMQSLREQSAGRQRLAMDELRVAMSWDTDRAIDLPAWQFPELPAGTAVPADAEQRALRTRHDLRAQEAMLRASRARIAAARSAFKPQVGVVAADSWYDDNAALDNKSQSIMGVVTLNLFSGGRDWHGVTAAQREAEANRRLLEASQQAARNEVRAATSRLNEAGERRRIASQGVDKAREAVRLVNQRYGEGRTILLDLLMAERALVEARQEELNAALQQEVSEAQLRLAEGMLLPGAPASSP